MTAATPPPPRGGEVLCCGATVHCYYAKGCLRPGAPSEPPAADSPTAGTETCIGDCRATRSADCPVGCWPVPAAPSPVDATEPPAETQQDDERHEWQCPSCGATTRARMADAQPSADTETLADQFMSSALDNIGAFDGSNDEARDRAYVRAELVALLNGIR